MQDLLELQISKHLKDRNVPALEKIREDLSNLLDTVSERVEKVLWQGLTGVREKKQLSEVQRKFAQVQGAIDSINKSVDILL